MLSLNEVPIGADILRTGRILLGCSIATNLFILKSLKGRCSKGPATKSFSTQEQIVSVTTAPCTRVDKAFSQKQLGKTVFCRDGAPFFKEKIAFFALIFSLKISLFSFKYTHFCSFFFTEIGVEILQSEQFLGKLSQKSSGGFEK
jgi:hypothetical protein